MNKLINEDIIKLDLLKSISERFSIPYESLLEEFNALTIMKTVKSKFSCDHNFFSRDNEKSFYWAGFIAADGCVFKKSMNSKTLTLSLAEKDYNHLLKLKNDINFNGNIYKSVTKHSLTNSKWNDSVKRSLLISSTSIFEDLKRFEINPNKTKVYTFPKWLINHNLVNHFMRGYNDGDGSFYYDKSRNRVCFELRGTKEFLTDYRAILELNLKKKSKVNVTTPDSTSKLKYSGKKIVPQIVEFLYKNSTICLERKYEIATRKLSYK